jgi:hypothetical protein
MFISNVYGYLDPGTLGAISALLELKKSLES